MMRERIAVTLGLVSTMLVAETAAATEVFLSPTTAAACSSTQRPVQLPIDSDAEFYVCIVRGTTASSTPACAAGASGQELCAFDVTLTATGAIEFADFFPEQASGRDVIAKHDEKSIRANELPNPPVLGPLRIGRVIISNTDLGGSVEAKGQEVRANLDIATIPDQVIAVSPVPEPGERILQLSGLALLAVLARIRRARTPARSLD